VKEIAVKISNSEQRYVQKFLCYDNFTISQDDEVLKKMVQDAINNFKGNVDAVSVKISMEW
jgi:hypothetical protein